MKKLAIAILVAAVLALSACSGGGNASNDSVTLSRADYDALRVEASGTPAATVQPAEMVVAPLPAQTNDEHLASLEPKKVPAVTTSSVKKTKRVAKKSNDVPPDPFANNPVIDDRERRGRQCESGAGNDMANGGCAY